MKKIVNAFLSLALMVGMCGCSNNSNSPKEQELPDTASQSDEGNKKEENVVQEEVIDDPAWDTLNSMGMIETENGLFYVKITLPSEFVGEKVTQESIDAGAGKNYTSGKLNEDGSVTYKMTKKQHKAMLEEMTASIDSSLKEMIDSGEYAVSEITHNADCTSFDVKLTTDEVGLQEGFMVMGLYMYGGMYSIFSGKKGDITVNYYSSSGKLIHTANSSEMSN